MSKDVLEVEVECAVVLSGVGAERKAPAAPPLNDVCVSSEVVVVSDEALKLSEISVALLDA